MKYPNHFKYITKIRLKLLAAGITGISRNDLNQATRTKYFQGSHMKETIDEWIAKGWVESFEVQGKKSRHPETIYRATTLLRDEWGKIMLEQELPRESKSDQDASQL